MTAILRSFIHQHEHLSLALIAAVTAHLLVVATVSFDVADPTLQQAQRTLDITLIRDRNLEKDEDAKLLAQANNKGSSDTQGDDQLQEIEPSAASSSPQQREEQTKQQAADNTAVLQQQESTDRLRIASNLAQFESIPSTPLPQMISMAQQQIAQLTEQIGQKDRSLSQHQRRKVISASTKEHRFAQYLSGWRKKIERVGNLNYPDQARRDKLYGTVLLHVAVRANGSLEMVKVLRSSGKKILDDAAVRSVKLAAPYAAFPADIRADIDILDITRTFQFRRGSQRVQ